MPNRSPQHDAFTLIELLVVVSIIALLIGILLPVLGSARQAARQTQCLSNQRQLGIAMQGYLIDHDDHYPQPAQEMGFFPAATQAEKDIAAGQALWFNALDYYLRKTQQAYDAGDTSERFYAEYKQDPVYRNVPEADRDVVRTIKMNAFFGYGPVSTPSGLTADDWRYFRAADITRVSDTVLLLDGRGIDTPSVTTGNTDADEFYASEIFAGLRHGPDGANVLFADLHARHHRDQVRQTGAGYQGWFAGTPDTNGYIGGGSVEGPHDLVWRIDRGDYSWD